MSDNRVGPSRCTVPGRQYVMHRLTEQGPVGEEVPTVDQELARAMQGPSPDTTLMRYYDFKALEDRACAGEATTRQDKRRRYDLDYVEKEPLLWELRLDVDGWLLRQYHAEPEHLPHLLVAVKAHVKVVFEDDEATAIAQNAEIQEGADRYRREQPRSWGWSP